MGGSGTQTQNASTTGSQAYYNSASPPEYGYYAAQSGLYGSNALMPQYNPFSPYPYLSQLPGDNSPNEYWYNAVNPSATDYRTWANIQSTPLTPVVAPMTQQQTAPLQQIYNWAATPSELINAANAQAVNTVRGDYLNPQTNPFLAAYANQAMGDVSNNYLNSILPQLQSAANRAGAFGGSSDTLMQGEAMRAYGDALARTATGIYNPAYEAERQRQQQAELYAPQVMQMPPQQLTAGLGVGDAYQQQKQAELNSLYQQWQQAQQWPYYALSGATGGGVPWISGYGISGGGQNYSQNTTSSVKGGTSPLSSIFGGALSGIGTGLMAANVMNPFAAGGIGALAAASSIFR